MTPQEVLDRWLFSAWSHRLIRFVNDADEATVAAFLLNMAAAEGWELRRVYDISTTGPMPDLALNVPLPAFVPDDSEALRAVVHAARDVDGLWSDDAPDDEAVLFLPEMGEALDDLRTALALLDPKEPT